MELEVDDFTQKGQQYQNHLTLTYIVLRNLNHKLLFKYSCKLVLLANTLNL